jgi:hypothetical protein
MRERRHAENPWRFDRVKSRACEQDIAGFTGEFAPVISAHGAGLYRVPPAK